MFINFEDQDARRNSLTLKSLSFFSPSPLERQILQLFPPLLVIFVVVVWPFSASYVIFTATALRR